MNKCKRTDFGEDDCENKSCTSSQFLQLQKKRLNDRLAFSEEYCNVSPVFGYNSAELDLKLFEF